MGQYTNNDGLTRFYGSSEASAVAGQPGKLHTAGAIKQLEIDLVHDNLVGFNADLDNDGTLDGFVNILTPVIAANSYIKAATIVVSEDWATSNSATLTVGLYEADGTVIDADGIDAAIAASALDLGDVVECDGALVAGGVTVGTADAYVRAVIDTGAFTTGEAKLVIEFI